MTKITFLKLLIIFSIVSFGITSFQHQNYTIEKLELNQILFENNQIIIETNLVEYKAPSRSVITIFLVYTVTNKTSKNLKVTYTKEAFYNGNCSSCGSPEALFEFTLQKKETKIGDCSNRNDRALKVFHSFKTGESNSVLTDLRLINVKITKI